MNGLFICRYWSEFLELTSSVCCAEIVTWGKKVPISGKPLMAKFVIGAITQSEWLSFPALGILAAGVRVYYLDCFDLCRGNPLWFRTRAVLSHVFHPLETHYILLLQLAPQIWITILFLTFTALVFIPGISKIPIEFSDKCVRSTEEHSPM